MTCFFLRAEIQVSHREHREKFEKILPGFLLGDF